MSTMNHLVLPHIYVMRKRFHTLLHLTSPAVYRHAVLWAHMHSLLPAAQRQSSPQLRRRQLRPVL